MKKILLLIWFIPLLVVSEDSFEEESADGDFEFSRDGQACYDYVNKIKGWELGGGNTTKTGSKFYVGVGADSSAFGVNSKAYIDGIQNAFIRAQMNAKTAIAESQAKVIQSEISNEFVQAFKEGKKPVNIIQAKDEEAQTYKDLSYYQKMKVLIHQKLDEAEK